MKYVLSFLLVVFWATGCMKEDNSNPFNPRGEEPVTPGATTRPASIGIVGDTSDVTKTTRGGIVIMGGGADVDAAFRWMIERSGGGDAVIIRASGTDAYNSYVNRLGTLNSVETLKIDSRRLAEDDGVARIIRNAELLFIAGGDQSDYTGYWKGTKVEAAINYLMTTKKVPVGGTSAGAAILGNFYFSGERGSVVSSSALANPFGSDILLYNNDFLKAPYLQNVITDQHFTQREREGRMMVFMARIMKDWGKTPQGIAVDEATAVCIDDAGMASVIGSNKAFFMKAFSDKAPEVMSPNTPLTWNWSGQAVYVSSVSARATDNKFNMVTFSPENTNGVTNYWWAVNVGSLSIVAE
ncbi:MAG: cyanophycinase [Chitinophagaceae bacterium]|nr:cyanophycinase [Chitinophagaceae bacterium]